MVQPSSPTPYEGGHQQQLIQEKPDDRRQMVGEQGQRTHHEIERRRIDGLEIGILVEAYLMRQPPCGLYIREVVPVNQVPGVQVIVSEIKELVFERELYDSADVIQHQRGHQQPNTHPPSSTSLPLAIVVHTGMSGRCSVHNRPQSLSRQGIKIRARSTFLRSCPHSVSVPHNEKLEMTLVNRRTPEVPLEDSSW